MDVQQPPAAGGLNFERPHISVRCAPAAYSTLLCWLWWLRAYYALLVAVVYCAYYYHYHSTGVYTPTV